MLIRVHLGSGTSIYFVVDSGSEEIVQCTYFILDANAVIQVCARGYVSVTGHLEGQRSSSQRNELGKKSERAKSTFRYIL